MEATTNAPGTPNGKPEEKVVLAGQEERTGARADFVSSILLMALGVGTIIECFRMPPMENWDIYAHPSFPPLFFGFLLVLFSAIVFVRSLYNRGYRLGVSGAGIQRLFAAPATRRFLFALAAVALYFGLMGHIHFVIATALFLLVMMFYFKAARWWVILLVSFGVALSMWVLFNQIFLVPLP